MHITMVQRLIGLHDMASLSRQFLGRTTSERCLEPAVIAALRISGCRKVVPLVAAAIESALGTPFSS